ncbi:dihydrofolate reductase [Amphibiibacter pelophylacis]|uniref:Dihydrofolate reductase n=1 Tax=Amphibiibacter pelophylacis TaxID=1799477 RepID=A0ACC6P4J4_9BURK
MPDVELILVAALDRSGGLGVNNSLLCHLPGDLRHFRQLTRGQGVLMGARTWDSLPAAFRPLPQRHNLVLSHKPAPEGLAATPQQALAQISPERPHTTAWLPGWAEAIALARALSLSQLWVIGGADIYRQALPHATQLWLTRIDHVFEAADAFFPPLDGLPFECTQRRPGPDDADWPYQFEHWVRHGPAPDLSAL